MRPSRCSTAVQNYRPRGYFAKERLVLKLFGLSLTENDGLSYKIYSFLILSLVNFSYPFLAVSNVYKYDFSVIADLLVYEFGALVGLLKTVAVLLNRVKFGKLLDKLEQAPFIPNPERGGNVEEQLIKSCVSITNAQTLFYWICTASSVFAGILATLVKRIRHDDYHYWQFPFGPFAIVNVTYSPNYEILWFYQSFSFISIGLHFTTIDLISASVLCHVSFQYKILQNNIRRIVSNSYTEMLKHVTGSITSSEKPATGNSEINPSHIPWKYLKKSLKEAVDYHLAIIDITDELENLLSSLLLLVFLGTLGILCFMVYATSQSTQNDLRLIRSIGEEISSCVQVLLICYWGEQVKFESQNVGQAAFEADFNGSDLKFQKALALIIRRSQNVTKITAGKFTDICLATFVWILRTSYSAFMVLRNSSNKKM